MKVDVFECVSCSKKYLNKKVADRCSEVCRLFEEVVKYTKALVKPKVIEEANKLSTFLSLFKEHNELVTDPFKIMASSDFYITVSYANSEAVCVFEAVMWSNILACLQSLSIGIEEKPTELVMFLDVDTVSSFCLMSEIFFSRAQ